MRLCIVDVGHRDLEVAFRDVRVCGAGHNIRNVNDLFLKFLDASEMLETLGYEMNHDGDWVRAGGIRQ
jgi:hypothetical protein